MSGPGRPRIGAAVKVCIPDAVREQVTELAAAEGVSMSEWIRRAIDARITETQPAPALSGVLEAWVKVSGWIRWAIDARVAASQPAPLSVPQVLAACRAVEAYARTCPELRRKAES